MCLTDDWGMLGRNPWVAVKPPRIKRREIEPLTVEQAYTLCEVTLDDPLQLLWIFPCSSCLRIGEALAFGGAMLISKPECFASYRPCNVNKAGD
jgi:hypothetical protein